MNTVRLALLGIVLTALLTGCHDNSAAIAATRSLTRADNAFSSLSAQQGFATAFKQYAVDDAVLLPENGTALKGKATIEQSLAGLPAGTTLSWSPQGADVSGDLGYTWGIYTLTGINTTGQPTAAYGKYLSVWKNHEGVWKLAVMMINQSPGPAG